MDHANHFMTPTTYRLHRLEYLVGFAVTIGLIIAHFHQVNWWLFAAMFLYIDLIGYIPGAIAYRRAPGHRIGKGYYVAYNVMHSLVTQGAVMGLWIWLIGPQWALIALPFHLCGDRGLFGNFLKPFGIPFEPERNEAIEQLINGLGSDPKKIAVAVGRPRDPQPAQ